MAIKFNPQQQEAFNRLKGFVKQNTINTFILKGYAGTGKTLLIQHLAEYLTKEKINYNLMATTGRAAGVLRGRTDLPTSTIHSVLYRFASVEGDDDSIPDDASPDLFGDMQLHFYPVEQLEKNCIYIIDEASMLASVPDDKSSYAVFGTGSLLLDFLKAAGRNKVIFVGDPAQLPPVHQNTSPALELDWLRKQGRVVAEAKLTQIMRTDEDNDILQMAQEVRNQIGEIAFSKWIKLPAKNRKKCKVVQDTQSLFLEYYAHYVQFGEKGSIAIAPSNRLCNQLNIQFRQRLFSYRNNILEVGEILMVNQNNYLVPLTNGDFVKVLSLGEISEKAHLKFQNVRIKQLETGKEFEIKLALDCLGNYNGNLTMDQQRNLMIDFSKRMRERNIRPKTEQYNSAMRTDPYLNSLRAGYGYVVTCHKSQGGEWEYVFLFLDKSMYAYMEPDVMRRWWYTAITRTKQQVYLQEGWWLK